MLKVAKQVSKKTVDGLMGLVSSGSVINTDDFTAYMHLSKDGWDHRVVNHWLNTFKGLQREPSTIRINVPVQLQL